jgi:hypothetical protein
MVITTRSSSLAISNNSELSSKGKNPQDIENFGCNLELNEMGQQLNFSSLESTLMVISLKGAKMDTFAKR